ncbi:Planctomycete cytochrome C [Posidoniimonas polymericola]|uniref:Planctomycete cytochrome C n=1 Tax=Posidoniimonas polymericola TaxID=2528002 RepID=A0A5C5ZF66_9BACT|nr:PSD1 and planctomycete cytochrome C domain-containing protein [Posidoniimonas polymericola]TWT85730.1 Planctomycete cytochrome C [Posidoniimonas polymericola]
MPRRCVHRVISTACVLGALSACVPTVSADEPIEFNEHIRPIFVEHCAGCHGGPKQAGGVSFLYRRDVLSEGDSGQPVVTPGDPEASHLIERVTEPDNDFRMPPKEHGPRLTDHEIGLLREWVRQGAAWQEHWSFVKPERPDRPAVVHDEWPLHELDYHVLARLEREGLAPSPLAPREQWLRRVTFDLTGLPPTEAQRDAYLADDAAGAEERVVERLLESPRFGERWAAMWMDLGRYADTMGYEKDLGRTMWPWRDWLIRALNADLPYDQFVVKQLAGDLLPNPTLDDRLATALHRNTQTNTEGGTDDEEFRLAAVIDRVNTTWQVFQAQTFGCVQCHTHPYDPIEHHEYYEFVAIFNNTRDADFDDEQPLLRVPADPADKPELTALDDEASRLHRKLHVGVLDIAGDDSQWQPLAIASAAANNGSQLVVKRHDGRDEVWTRGTIASGTDFTLQAAPSGDLASPITALRIDALPKDAEQALRIPEDGFVVTRLSLQVIAADGSKLREVEVRSVFCDEPEPMFDPRESLRDSTDGWAAYTKLFRRRWAVFVLAEPLELPPNARLQITLDHDREGSGQTPLVLGRSRFSISTSQQWGRLQQDPKFVASLQRLDEIANQAKQIACARVPVMQQRDPRAARNTYTFVRGNWLERGEQVRPGTPDSLPPLPTDNGGNRLDMAHWIASPENPLTARTLVNRVWEQLFGLGVVETVEDLGASGAEPSNQPLLDLLATQLQGEMHWSFKSLLREIVLSATYRQDSRVSAELAERDPRNTLLARGPRTRLQAEMVRDQALLLSGRLCDKPFGPPVMPYQPDGVWRSVYSGAAWETSPGEDRFRRAVYTYWKRTSAYPSLMAFDMTSREVCTPRRLTTNTPLQALVTLNDPAYVELAQALGERMTQHGKAPAEQIAWAYRLAVGMPAADQSVRELLDLYHAAEESYRQDPAEAAHLGGDAAAFARTVLANAILNLDASMTK